MKLSTSILRSTSPVLFAAMSLYGLGCIADPNEMGLDADELNVSQVEQGAGGDPGTTNHYSVACFQDHGVQQTFRELGAGPLVGTSPILPTMQYLPDDNASVPVTGCRQQALDMLIECALNEAQAVRDPQTGFMHTGALGFAPEWMTQALTTDQKELVTACMLQRLNPYGVTIPVVLEAPASPFTTTDYPLHESQAWGNLFDSTVTLNPTRNPTLPTYVPFTAYACDEGDRPTFCDEEGSIVPWQLHYTLMRTCFFNDAVCDWTALGACTATCTTDPNDPGKCDAWDNRLRARARDDGSLCGIPTQ